MLFPHHMSHNVSNAIPKKLRDGSRQLRLFFTFFM